MTAITCVVAAMMTLAGRPAQAQAMSGRDLGVNEVHVAYYKTPPGRQDEWLAVYKKYHQPIMDYEIKKGVVISNTMFAPRYHDGAQSWDFVIITVTPPAGKGPQLGMTRAQLIRKLFPDIEDYARGERQRWALTLVCQEGDLVQIDTTRNPLSLYYPLDIPEKKE
ncbi:MAG: hypothetical protein JSR67_05410 [Proteobacteria bacterium]|nr:hypothetical protein [Pseudomonadota bacterium]